MSHYFPSPPTSPAERKRKRSVTPSQQPQQRKQVKLDPSLLERYLTGGGSPNIRDAQRGFSLLCWACYSKSESALKLLLRQDDLDPNTTHGPDRSTALHIAAAVGFLNGMENLLLIRQINVNALDANGQTPLHRAVLNNQPGCLEKLLQHGARTDVQDSQGRLALHIASLYRRSECVNMLLRYLGDDDMALLSIPNKVDGRSVLEECVVGGCASILQQLLKKQQEEEKRKNNNLIPLAVFWNRIECLEVLLGAGCDVGAQVTETDPTDTPLYRAVQQRKLDMVRCLRRANANPCLPNGNNPSLLYAAGHGFLEMVPLLVTSDTSQDCIRQALVLAEPLGLAEALLRITRNGIY
ncbi:ankyrin repeat-containing domain protein [Fennellomyces sp. T-0311]|nr:ankyrin repeat-containing domain protein [Fennellomyces sp. T-0311]